MKFGKLENVDNIDFSLGNISPDDRKIIAQSSDKMEFKLGCTGWAMKEWRGMIFPPKAKPDQYLGYYAQSFDTIEMNTTHYRIPKQEQVLKWKSQVGEGFEFCPKIPQSISHSRTLGVDDSKLLDFCLKISLFEENLGPCFMQLPSHFGYEKREVLRTFFEKWPADMPLSVELRHEDIYEEDHFSEIVDLLQEYNKGFVITDVAGRRDMAKILLTAPYLLVRFVGNNFHPTDYERADEWIEIAHQYQAIGLDKIHFFVHEPDNVDAPKMADYIINGINQYNNINVRQLHWQNPTKQLTLF